MRHIIAAFFVLNLAACALVQTPTPTPDVKATEAQIYVNVIASITAGVPTQTKPPTATLTPTITNTPRPAGAVAIGSAATVPPLLAERPPRPTPGPTPTRSPSEIRITGFDEPMDKLVHEGLDVLRTCEPSVYTYIQSQVEEITTGWGGQNPYYSVSHSGRIVYIAIESVSAWAWYPDSLRRFIVLTVVAHGARRLDLGPGAAVSDVNSFVLPLFDRCKPNDIGDEGNAWNRQGANPYWLFLRFRRWFE